MKRELATTLSLAALSMALLNPLAARAQSQNVGSAQMANDESLQMVSARVALTENLDAGKAKAGDQVRTTLAKKVTLKNGTVLPAGTVILGVVSTDDMERQGTSKLALTFTKAELKDGTVVPIKATMVGVYPPQSEDSDGRPIAPGDQVTNAWAQHADAVDEIGALPGVDLHSSISSSNSGVLVSSSKHDVKLHWGSEIALAVAPQTTAQGE
jgi:hypothetical protein